MKLLKTKGGKLPKTFFKAKRFRLSPSPVACKRHINDVYMPPREGLNPKRLAFKKNFFGTLLPFALNPLRSNINIHVFLTVLHVFLKVGVQRI